jgi:hypothetical protein
MVSIVRLGRHPLLDEADLTGDVEPQESVGSLPQVRQLGQIVDARPVGVEPAQLHGEPPFHFLLHHVTNDQGLSNAPWPPRRGVRSASLMLLLGVMKHAACRLRRPHTAAPAGAARATRAIGLVYGARMLPQQRYRPHRWREPTGASSSQLAFRVWA